MAGRPRKYKTPEELEKAVDSFYESEEGQTKPTISGLMIHLGFYDHSWADNYKGYSEAFSEIVKKAYLLHEHFHACNILGKSANVGSIITLKHIHSWRDNQKIELEGEINLGPIKIVRAKSKKPNET